ncbi:MAG TPA: polysaccharide deacetylase family protein [Candidatus Merdenecus merdavium]|nr:polysaccharide deacetylase family protein [Candidatus Merdenecus merdavium]
MIVDLCLMIIISILALKVKLNPSYTKEKNIGTMSVAREEQAAGASAEEGNEVKPKIALTFDDGPHPVYTSKLLDGLKSRGVKATFFIVGKNINGNEEIVKRMDHEGHLIGNHTFNHVQINLLNDTEAQEELTKTSDTIEEITGHGTEYIRPPFGVSKKGLDQVIPMISVLWTVDPLDWTTENVDKVVNQVVTKVKENDIILLHDYYDSSIEAAFRIIDILQKEGYEFVTVDELILD